MAKSEPIPTELLKAGPILLYDGECGVCSGSVQWILRHERQSTLRFAPLQSDAGQRLVTAANISPDVDSLLWMELCEGKVTAKKWSGAVLKAAGYVGGPWRLALAAHLLPRPLRDALYRLFARNRKSFTPPTCLVPSPETRARFLSA